MSEVSALANNRTASHDLAAWLARLNNLARASVGRVLACRPDGTGAAIYGADRAPSGDGWIRWTVIDAELDADAVLAILADPDGDSPSG